MEEKLSCSVAIHEESHEGKKVFVVECTELGVSDFGETIEEAMNNLKLGLNLLLESAPEKRKLLLRKEPLMISRLFL
jgi:predicted RNase H-like HicB family nuclease